MKKKIGYGSVSGVLFLFAIIFSFTLNGFTVGDEILNFFNLKAWSTTTGFHYTIIYSILLIILSLFIGKKYPDNIGSICISNKKSKVIFVSCLILLLLLNINI